MKPDAVNKWLNSLTARWWWWWRWVTQRTNSDQCIWCVEEILCLYTCWGESEYNELRMELWKVRRLTFSYRILSVLMVKKTLNAGLQRRNFDTYVCRKYEEELCNVSDGNQLTEDWVQYVFYPNDKAFELKLFSYKQNLNISHSLENIIFRMHCSSY
jgi:hypothetical protein